MYFGHDIEFIKHELTVLTTTEISIQVRLSIMIEYPKHLSLCKILVKKLHHFILNEYLRIWFIKHKNIYVLWKRNESKLLC